MSAIRVMRSLPPIESGRHWSIPLAITNHTPAAISPLGACPVGVRVEWRSYSGQPCGVPVEELGGDRTRPARREQLGRQSGIPEQELPPGVQ